MKRILLGLWLTLLSAGCAQAEGGRFDYYVLSLSWSPQYCATEGRPNETQCARPYGFVVHGLWPQFERGYPDHCGQGGYLSDSLIGRMLAIMPSKSLIIHEWKKHGVCTGLEAQQYFSTIETAYKKIQIPSYFQNLGDYLSTTPSALKTSFVNANPSLEKQSISLQCRDRYLQEVRVCLTKSLEPRACGSDMRDRCGQTIVFRPSR